MELRSTTPPPPLRLLERPLRRAAPQQLPAPASWWQRWLALAPRSR